MKSTIAFLGTGLMGEPMCHNLLEAGLPLTVWNRSKDKTKRLAKRGAGVADSPHDAVTGADVVITMLSDGRTKSQMEPPGLTWGQLARMRRSTMPRGTPNRE